MKITPMIASGLALALAGFPRAAGQNTPDTPPWRLLRASEGEQIAAVDQALDHGLPPGEANLITLLIINKSSLVLPRFELKIQQVLNSASPQECFTNKDVDPQKFVLYASLAITEAGDEYALREISKLMRLDERRFGKLVTNTLFASRDYATSHNPFVVAYRAFALGDPALDQRIIAWAEAQLSTDPEERASEQEISRRFRTPLNPPPSDDFKRLWADAMLDRYGGVPTDAQWTADPIASRLSAPLAESLHRDVPRFAREALEKRAPR
jgi:hypothetical protein